MRLALIGPVWVQLLQQLGWFNTRQAAQRRMSILEDDGRIKYLGRARVEGHKKVHVWSNRNVGRQFIQHETDVMRIYVAYWPHANGLTGRDADQKFRADMDMTVGDRMYRVEMNEETEPFWQIEKRLKIYDDCPNTVLFVTKTASMVPEVLKLTQNPRVYVTTLEEAVSDPWGAHWINRLGEREPVAKPVA